jgi:hypothetical protein
MLEKRVIVYLDTGATREHVVEVEDDDAYVKKYNEFVDVLKDDTWSLLIFGEPLCIYKVKNIIAIEISDPPLSNKLPMGFMATKR